MQNYIFFSKMPNFHSIFNDFFEIIVNNLYFAMSTALKHVVKSHLFSFPFFDYATPMKDERREEKECAITHHFGVMEHEQLAKS